jgi:hypothetical protein
MIRRRARSAPFVPKVQLRLKKAMVFLNTRYFVFSTINDGTVARSRNRPYSGSSSTGIMSRLLGALIVLALIVVVGGSVLLATWEIPAPSKTVERVIPDDRFPR